MSIFDAFQTLVDFEVGLNIRDFKSDQARKIFLACKTLTNMLGAVSDVENDNGGEIPAKSKARVRGILARSNLMTKQLLGQMNELSERGGKVSLMRGALEDVAEIVSKSLKSLNK